MVSEDSPFIPLMLEDVNKRISAAEKADTKAVFVEQIARHLIGVLSVAATILEANGDESPDTSAVKLVQEILGTIESGYVN